MPSAPGDLAATMPTEVALHDRVRKDQLITRRQRLICSRWISSLCLQRTAISGREREMKLTWTSSWALGNDDSLFCYEMLSITKPVPGTSLNIPGEGIMRL